MVLGFFAIGGVPTLGTALTAVALMVAGAALLLIGERRGRRSAEKNFLSRWLFGHCPEQYAVGAATFLVAGLLLLAGLVAGVLTKGGLLASAEGVDLLTAYAFIVAALFLVGSFYLWKFLGGGISTRRKKDEGNTTQTDGGLS